MLNSEFHILLDDPEEDNFIDTFISEVSASKPLTPALRPAIKDYPQNFVMELALGLETEDALCVRYDFTPEEYALLLSNKTFQSDLANWKQRMADEGLSFKLKARVQAESYLMDIDGIIHDPSTSNETKLAAISRVVSWGGLDQKATQESSSSKPSITINITRFSDSKTEAIEIN